MATSSNRLSSVSFLGSGSTVAMFEGHLVDTNAVLDSSSHGLVGLPDAGGGSYTLRTDIEGWKPTGGNYAITLGGHSLGIPTADDDGVAVYRNADVVCVTNGYFEATNITWSVKKYTWLTNAVAKAREDDLIKAAQSVSPGAAWAAGTPVVLDLNGFKLGGVGPSGEVELVISNGYLAVTSLPDANARMASGQATAAAKDLIGSRTVGGHKFVQLLSSETHDGTDFQYRVMPVATGESDMKAALVKADMEADFSWTLPAQKYMELYCSIV